MANLQYDVARMNRWLLRLFAPVTLAALLAGCAHATRCDRREDLPTEPQPPPGAASDWRTGYKTNLQAARDSYKKGMRLFEHNAGLGLSARGHWEFGSVVAAHTTGAGGGGDGYLFEQLENGEWAYRCDDMTRLFALSAYRAAVLEAEDGSYEAPGNFCVALHARPDVVLAIVRKEGLSPNARAAFEQALRNPRCYFEDGYRGSPYGVYVRPDPG